MEHFVSGFVKDMNRIDQGRVGKNVLCLYGFPAIVTLFPRLDIHMESQIDTPHKNI